MMLSPPGYKPNDQSPEPPTCRMKNVSSSDIFYLLPHSPHSYRRRTIKMDCCMTQTSPVACAEEFQDEVQHTQAGPPSKHEVLHPWPRKLGW